MIGRGEREGCASFGPSALLLERVCRSLRLAVVWPWSGRRSPGRYIGGRRDFVGRRNESSAELSMIGSALYARHNSPVYLSRPDVPTRIPSAAPPRRRTVRTSPSATRRPRRYASLLLPGRRPSSRTRSHQPSQSIAIRFDYGESIKSRSSTLDTASLGEKPFPRATFEKTTPRTKRTARRCAPGIWGD